MSAQVLYEVYPEGDAAVRVCAHVRPSSIPTILDRAPLQTSGDVAVPRLEDVSFQDGYGVVVADRILVPGRECFRLTYRVILPEWQGPASMLHGFAQNGSLFINTSVVLFVVAGDADYALSCRGHAAMMPAMDRDAMQEGYLALGRTDKRSYSLDECMVHCLCEPGAPWSFDALGEALRRICSGLIRHLGPPTFSEYSFFFFPAAELSPNRPGAGYALPAAALVALPVRGISLMAPQNLWLLAHEWAHHWLGFQIRSTERNNGWIFEGLASYIAAVVVEQEELAPQGYTQQLCALSLNSLKGDLDQSRKEHHQGFLRAMKLDQELRSKGGALASELRRDPSQFLRSLVKIT
ncbi:hypothetical protein [Desulfobulbus alkaliphilus]|uniref:hypothetical protein n=1 Tax=Desulfobulbus alkaliphilus TaxID=869814 RepID=UPI001964D34F|nr:hypothetical protein [Desulfobulbus alkaliphilus]MBM9535990.1 hypothetical protein [Desulfobulbus alkaliphilus]